MSTDTPNGQPPPGDPTWWPTEGTGKDEFRPPTVATVTALPTAPQAHPPAGIGAAPFPPMPPAPPPAPPAPPTPPPPAPGVVPDATSTEVAPAGRPARDRFRNVGATAHKNRRWVAIGGVAILGLVAVRMFANDVSRSMGDAVAEPLATHNSIVTDIVAEAAAANSEPSQVSVQQPLSWLNCPVAKDAGTMIGWDPNTQYATLDPQRAADVETQVRALVVQNPLSALRITTADKTRLTVTVGGAQGTPLVDCSGAATAARPDPSAKTGGDTATTVAPR